MYILPQAYGGANGGAFGGDSEGTSEEAFPWVCRGEFVKACQREEEWDSGLA